MDVCVDVWMYESIVDSLVRWIKAWTYRRMNKWMNRSVKISNGWNVWINRLILIG